MDNSDMLASLTGAVNTKLRLLPYFVVRVCGGSFVDFDELRLKKTAALIDELIREEKQLEGIRDSVCEQLYQKIQFCPDRAQRNQLIRLKRDIYNSRPITNNIEGLSEYSDLISRVEQVTKKISWSYEQSIFEIRHRLFALAGRETFQKGLVLSSGSLYKELCRLEAKPPSTRNISKTELGLVKYLSRVYAKATPFSVFTSIGLGLFTKKDDASRHFQLGEKKPFVRLNNAVGRYLEQLLIENHDFACDLPVQLNETVWQDSTVYVFLANDNNHEAIQRLAITPALKTFYSLINKMPGVSINKLVQLCQKEQLFQDRPEEIKTYLRQLIELGFLYFLPLSLEQMHFGQMNSARRHMATMARFANKLGGMSATRRAVSIGRLFDKYRDICKQLYIRAGLPVVGLLTFGNTDLPSKNKRKREIEEATFRRRQISGFTLKQEQMFYEDTALAPVNKLPQSAVMPIIESLTEFLHPFLRFNLISPEQKIMRNLFLRHYPTGTTVPLLTFYKQCYRSAVQKSESGRYWSYCRSVAHAVLSQSPVNGETVEIKPHHLSRPRHADFGFKNNPPRSLSVYLQLFFLDNKLTAVFNDLNGGYGRSFSRFLPMFDPRITSEIREWNTRISPNAILAENNDASVFNANIHPPLLDWEIRMPGSTPHLPEEQQLSVGLLEVMDNPDRKRLELRDSKSLQPVLIFDLGFQGLSGRSPLFTLLNCFGPAYNLINPHGLRRYLHYPRKEGVTRYPRICYGSLLIIWRRAWSVTRAYLPLAKPHEPEADYFLRLNRWRIVTGLPETVFVSLTNKPEIRSLKKTVKRLTLDDYKPQYIDFTNPFLVRLFAKMLNRVTKRLWIEEMLPGRDQLLQFDDKRYASEFIFQWDQK